MTISANVIPPMIATLLVMLGNGYLTSILSLDLANLGHTKFTIGVIGSLFNMGMLIGSLKNESFILKVDHIRSYVTFVVISGVMYLMHGITENIYVWGVLRIIEGYCMAGIYIVIESWLLNLGNNSNRGTYLAIYLIALYGGQSLGQLLIKLDFDNDTMKYALINILTILSIIPLTSKVIQSPKIEEVESVSIKKLFRISGSGTFGAIFSGMILSAILVLLPTHSQISGFDKDQISLIMFTTILGGMVLQYPIGKISDVIERRTVLAIISFIISLISLVMFFVGHNFSTIIAISFLFGGMAFTIYPVALSHACEMAGNKNIVSLTQGIILAYGIGSIIGPLVVSYCLDLYGEYGFYKYTMILGIIGSIFFATRAFMNRRKISTHVDFSVHAQTTPIAAVLEPVRDEK